jgi:hypothetical protein
LEAEVEFHFEREVELHMSRGMSEKEARLAACRRFGGIDRAKEAYRDTRGLPVVETLFRDLGYGARMLRRSPDLRRRLSSRWPWESAQTAGCLL